MKIKECDRHTKRDIKRILNQYKIFLQRAEIITLRESHYEDEINRDESEEIARNHSVNHHDKWSDCFEASTEE